MGKTRAIRREGLGLSLLEPNEGWGIVSILLLPLLSQGLAGSVGRSPDNETTGSRPAHYLPVITFLIGWLCVSLGFVLGWGILFRRQEAP